jgi:predicted ATPase
LILDKLYVRFFRSFNFDYLRQEKDDVEEHPWDIVVSDERSYYPFVNVDLERDITTVVGANEAGKSQLITAIQCLLGDKPISPRDFCRYSLFFSVQGTLPVPEFGGHFTNLTTEERSALSSVASNIPAETQDFWLFRHPGAISLYWRTLSQFETLDITEQQVEMLLLPRARRISADVPLPASVSLYDLKDLAALPDSRSRSDWDGIHKALKVNEQAYIQSGTLISGLLTAPVPQDSVKLAESQKALSLIRDLLEKVAGVDTRTYSELLEAGGADDGYSAALTASMTSALAVSLNFPAWWTQDQDFSLEVHKDSFYLVLTMRDRTGQTYTFDERSGGMKFFLSYFIQYKAYEPQDRSRSEILLMDEPDAFLSTQGQQDLLHIFERYAHPDTDTPAAQVLYVTHSPFLIDKNHPERIRVLQKGLGEEGTRVVTKAATDNYEPLRSAFGSFHADTAFIGNCNLLVEGPADLILFSAVSAAMRQKRFDGSNLDLNDLTMVPVHGASQYRYMIHMTRSGAIDRPAVVVLLDSDAAGREADSDLAKLENGFGRSSLLNPDLIFRISEIDTLNLDLAVQDVHEPEDLISAEVAMAVLNRVVEKYLPADQAAIVRANIPATIQVRPRKRLFDEVSRIAKEASAEASVSLSLGKIEFARALGECLADLPDSSTRPLFEAFSRLFGEINSRQLQAMTEHREERLTQVTRRLVERFRRDHKKKVRKHSVVNFLEEVAHHLEGSKPEEEIVRQTIRQIREEYKLSESPSDFITDMRRLHADLSDLVYKSERS